MRRVNKISRCLLVILCLKIFAFSPNIIFAENFHDYFDVHGIRLGMTIGEITSKLGKIKFRTLYSQFGVIRGYYASFKKDGYDYSINLTSDFSNRIVQSINVTKQFENNLKLDFEAIKNKLKKKYGKPNFEFHEHSYWNSINSNVNCAAYGVCKRRHYTDYGVLDGVECKGKYLYILYKDYTKRNNDINSTLNVHMADDNLSQKDSDLVKKKVNEVKKNKEIKELNNLKF